MKTNSRIILSIICALTLSTAEAATTKISPALQAIIQEILQNKTAEAYKNFSVKECPKHKIDWVKIILRREKQTLSYKFTPGCDIDGSVSPQVMQDFPIDFKLRNLDEFSAIKGNAKLAPTFGSSKPLLRLDLNSTEIIAPKEKIKFSAYYETEINPLSKNIIGKHLGGKIFIEEINGKKMKEEFPLPPAQSK